MSTTTATPAATTVAAIYSMTGFARTTARVSDTLGFTLTLKSVNHRFLDLHLRLPTGSDELEMRLRRGLKEKIGRGHVELTLALDRTSKVKVQYNRTLVAAYLAAFHAASQEFGIIQEPNLNTIFRLPGVLAEDVSATGESDAELADAVIAQLDTLVAELNTMRAQEGQSLAAELRAGLDRLEALVDEVAKLREDIQRAYFERVSQRLTGLLNGSFDQERVLQEAALLAERSDVEEEITRLHTHIEHFRALLDGGGEIGKKTDFLLQELNREANTLLSKTGGVAGNGPRITELGLGMKSEIEKAREQVQNLE
jgi:uncharacterized protein (TIGR00255 family)